MSKKKPSRNAFVILKDLFGERIKKAYLSLGIMAVYTVLLLASSIVFAFYGVDNALQSNSWKIIVLAIGGSVLLAALSNAFFHIAWRISMKNKRELCIDLRKKVFNKMIHFDSYYYSKHATGAMLHTVVSDIQTVADGGVWNVLWMFSNILTIVLSLIIATIIHPLLSLILWVVVPLALLFSFFLMKKISVLYTKRTEVNKKRLSHINEGIMGYTTIKTLNLDDRNVMEFKAHTSLFAKLRFTIHLYFQVYWRFFDFIVLLCLVALYVLSYKQYISLNISLGGLYLYFILFTNCLYSVAGLSMDVDYFTEVMVAARKVDAALQENCLVHNKEKTIEGVDFKGDILLDNVTFKYPEGETILDNFTLHIKPKEKIAIVGRTGSGKSTIASLIYRFYEPNKGKLLFDGVDYTDYTIEHIHSKIGYILQDPLMFDDSIFNNIRYGKLDATLEEVIEVAKLVGIHEYIDSLEDKYESNMGEGGVSLSLGQKQLISFARVLLNNPDIIILDEATANVDTETERLIQSSIDKMFKDKTCIFIAHRLSTIRDVDRILYLDKGVVLEEGNHNFLMKEKGRYYSLYQSQFINDQLENA